MDLNRKKKSVEWNFVLYMFRRLMSLIYPLITFSYASQVLGVEALGNFNFARSFSQCFALVALMGIGRYGNREGAKIRNDKEAFSRLAHELFFISFIATFSITIIYGICVFSLPGLQAYRQMLLILMLSVIFNTQFGLEWVYTANEDFTYITVRAVLLQILGIVALFVFVKTPEDLWKYALIHVFATCGTAIFNYLNAHRYIYWRWIGNYHILYHLKSLLYLMAVNISVSIYSDLDTIMLGFLSNDYIVGIYTAAVKLNRIVNQLITCFGTVAMPKLSYYYGNGKNKEFYALANEGYHIVFMLSIPIFVGMFLLSGEFILLLCGDEFISAAVTAKILAPIILLIPFSTLTKDGIFIPMKRESTVLVISLFGAVANVAANSFLIPSFAENGAAVATLLAEGTVALVCVIRGRKVLRFSEIFAGYWKYWAAAGSIVFIKCAVSLFINSTLGVVVCTIFFSVVSYFLILWLLKDQLVRSIWSDITRFIKGKPCE